MAHPVGPEPRRGTLGPVEQDRPLPRDRWTGRVAVRVRARRQLAELQRGGRHEAQAAVAAVAPDEPGDELVRRVREQLVGRRELRQATADTQHGHAVAQADGLVDVVGDEQDRLAEVGLQAQQLVLQLDAHHGVDRRERLVHEQHRRVTGQRAGHPDALLLAAGELRGPALRHRRVEADALEHLGRPGPGLLAREALEHRHRRHVVEHAAVRKEAGLLDDVADAATQQRRIALGDVLAGEQHRARRGLDHAVDGAQRGGLAAARGPHQHRDLTLAGGQRQRLQADGAVGEALSHVPELDHVRRPRDPPAATSRPPSRRVNLARPPDGRDRSRRAATTRCDGDHPAARVSGTIGPRRTSSVNASAGMARANNQPW